MMSLRLTAIILGSTVLWGCADEMKRYEVTEYDSIANAASVHCVQQGGTLDTVSEDNHRVTYCVLKDGERVEQDELYERSK